MKKTLLIGALFVFSFFLLQCGEEEEEKEQTTSVLDRIKSFAKEAEESQQDITVQSPSQPAIEDHQASSSLTGHVGSSVGGGPVPKSAFGTFVCTKDEMTFEYKLYLSVETPYVCQADAFLNGNLVGYWNAEYQEGYCLQKIGETVEAKKAEGYDCDN